MKTRAESWWTNWRSRVGWWCAVIGIFALGWALRVAHYHEGYGHPDETITTEVVGHMRSSGDWDTNWAKAPNLEAGLRYDQYNFSSHLLATFGFYRLVKVLPGTAGWRSADGGFWVYRFFSVVLATLAVGLAMHLGWRTVGAGGAVGAGLLVAIAPILVQDAHFSRPEAFVTVLTLLAVALCWPGAKPSSARVLGAAGVIGVLVACKISMLALAWMPLVPWWMSGKGRPRRRTWLLAAMPVTVVAGFALGAPGAVAHPRVFVHGVQHLMEQYAGLHPPHSHMNGGPVGDMLAAYFVATLGWPVVIAMAWGAGVLAWRRQWAELVLLAGPVVLFAGYFATRGVFFERNLSHVVPLALVLSALGFVAVVERVGRGRPMITGLVAGGLVIAGAAPMLLRVTWPLVQIEFSGVGARRHEAFERELKAKHANAEFKDVQLLNDGPLAELDQRWRAGKGPVLLRVADYHDEWTAYNLGQMKVRFEVQDVVDVRGTFPGVPTCTLLTYHSPRHRYFLVTGVRLTK